MGGLHLSGANEAIPSPQTVAALGEFGLAQIAAGHCTGWRAIARALRRLRRQGAGADGGGQALYLLMQGVSAPRLKKNP